MPFNVPGPPRRRKGSHERPPPAEGGQQVVGSAELPQRPTTTPPPPSVTAGGKPTFLRPAQEMLQPEEGGPSDAFRNHYNVQRARQLLEVACGLVEGDHGTDTPRRFVEMLSDLTGHRECDGSCMKFRTFSNDGMDEMIVVQDIPFVSVCNHHVIPFMGHAHVAYVPDKKIAGLSKFARVVDHFARALQVQERLTAQVADFLEEKLQPRGVGVIMRAEHLCMTIRGVQKPGALTTTAAMKGVFADHSRTAKSEFMQYLQNGKH